MQLQDLIPIIFERFSAFQTLWSLYITIVLGVIGFVSSAESAMHSKLVQTVVTIGFVAFATVNLTALDNVRAQRTILIDLASKKTASETDKSIQALLDIGRPSESRELRAFHLSADVFVIVLIWSVPKFRLKHKNDG